MNYLTKFFCFVFVLTWGYAHGGSSSEAFPMPVDSPTFWQALADSKSYPTPARQTIQENARKLDMLPLNRFCFCSLCTYYYSSYVAPRYRYSLYWHRPTSSLPRRFQLRRPFHPTLLPY